MLVKGHLNFRKISKTLLFISFSITTSTVFATTSLWQGPYLGVYAGGGFGNNHLSTNVGSVTATSYFVTGTDINAVNAAGTSTHNPSTGIIGIEAGHDWVWEQLVYGVVFDYTALPLSSSNTVNATYPNNPDVYSIRTTMNTNRLFTLRGRLGYQTIIHCPTLFYLTGGMATTKLNISNNFSDNSAFAGIGASNASENEIGWTAGAGIEVASFGHLFVDLEYLYVHVPSIRTTSYITNTQGGFGIPTQSLTNPFSTSGKFHASLIKIGLNYKFDE